MSGKEIKELRIQGLLQDALEMAMVEYQDAPENIWCKRNLAWVYAEMIKQKAVCGDVDGVVEIWNNLLNLRVLRDETMLSNVLCWHLRTLLATIERVFSLEEVGVAVQKVFVLAQTLNPEKPGKAYSVLAKAFYRLRRKWNGFIDFMDWWGWKSFLSEDYQREVFNGKKMPISLVEGCYIAYAKELLEKGDVKLIEEFLPKMENINREYPDMSYIGYYMGKLMLKLGQKGEKALEIIIPFVRKKKTEFWTWQLMAEVLEGDREKYIACLLRAVNCNVVEHFLIKIYYTLLHVALNEKDYVGCCYYIDKYVKVKNQLQLSIPREIDDLMKSEWFGTSLGKSKFDEIDYMYITDTLLMNDLPEHVAVVTFVNEVKQMASVVWGKQCVGFFCYRNLLKHVYVGQVLCMRWEKCGEDGFIKALTVRNVEGVKPDSSFWNEVEGEIVFAGKNEVCFLKNGNEMIFVPKVLVRNNNLQKGVRCNAEIIYDYDKKKCRWGWRCFCLKGIVMSK